MTDDTDLMPIDETLAERRSKFLTMRLAQMTFSTIAERHNAAAVNACLAAGRPADEAKTVTPATVRKDVDIARRSIIDESTREALIAEETQVILDVRRANYGAMASGDIDAAKIILATVTHRRELWGLDAPKRAALGVGTDVEFARDLADLIQSVGVEAPPDLLFAAHGERRAVSGGALEAAPALDAEVVPDPETLTHASAYDDIRHRLDTTSPDPRPAPPEDDAGREPSWSNL